MKLSISCIIGLVFFIVGIILRTYPLESINSSIGYRTPFSTKNKDTWDEGNRFMGNNILIIGVVFIPFSILIRYLFGNNLSLSKSITILGLFILFIGSIILTEIHLRNLFDKNGIRK